MKIKNIITMCALALAVTGTGSLLAQDTGNGGGGGGGGNGGGPPGGGGRRFDPAQMQQRIMENVQSELEFTNDTDWNAVQPLVQKVLDARRDVGFGNMGRLFGRGRGGPGGGDQGNRQRRGGGGPFGQPSPEQDALQKAIDDNAPSSQVKDLLAKYEESQKAKHAKLQKAQDDLRAVLTVKQEATATLLGLLD
jgi:hypothetical protein